MLRLAEHPNIIGVRECTQSCWGMAYLIVIVQRNFWFINGEGSGDAFHAMNLVESRCHNGDEMFEMLDAIANDIKSSSYSTEII